MLFVLLAAPGLAASAQVHIEDVRVGFGLADKTKEGNYKVGNWAPVRVRVRTEKEAFDGMLELTTSDSDDVATTYRRQLHVDPNDTIEVASFFKPGKMSPELGVRLVDDQGRTRAREMREAIKGEISDPAAQNCKLFVAVGRPAGLDAKLFAEKRGYGEATFRMAGVPTARELPTRWFGYDAADAVILCTDNIGDLEKLDVAAQDALKTWVRNGGQLVVSLSTSWDRVMASFLGEMLPAKVDGTVTVKELKTLEDFVERSSPLNVKSLSVPKLVEVRGRILAGTPDLPLVVQGAYGLGTVTLVPLELNRDPFAIWDGRTDFWIKLLGIRKNPHPENVNVRGYYAYNDLSSYLRLQLEQFQGISLVPFQWVAFFIFLYILLIGPVDYLLVKKVFRRMELTWITFPTMVIVVSLAAYFTAYWLKGSELRINKVDLIDVDQASNSVRGTTWFTLFSPQIKNYTIRIEPTLAAAPPQTQAPGGPTVNVSWLGLAEDALGGMGRQGGMGLFRRGYAFAPDAAGLVEVPIQVWSMKGFTARWQSPALPAIEANLTGHGMERLEGTLTNRLPVPLDDAWIAYGRHIYPLGAVAAQTGSVVVGVRPRVDLKGEITRRAQGYLAQQNLLYRGRYGGPEVTFAPENLLFTMGFFGRLSESTVNAENDYFNDLDLSGLLDHGRAILFSRITAPGCKLFLNETETTENVHAESFLRVLIPVKTGAADPEMLNPPIEKK